MNIFNKYIGLAWFLVISIFLISSTSFAHQIRVFAYGTGNTIVGETAYGNGRPPKHAEIIIQNVIDNKVLFTCAADHNGQFSFLIPAEAKTGRIDLKIIANDGGGHRAEWILKADEYLTVNEHKTAAIEIKEQIVSETISSVAEIIKTDEVVIRRVVEEELEKKLGSVKNIIMPSDPGHPSARDILGGLGYIMGLTGLIAYYKARGNVR